MTSLLAFAWRQANGPCNGAACATVSSSEVDRFEPYPFSQPGVSASSSGETLTNPPSSDTLFDTTSEKPKTSSFAGPDTPDALRQRRTADEIREELGLPRKRLNWEMTQNDMDASSAAQNISSCSSPVCSVLPPMFGACGNLPSPQISTSSFYSKTSRSTQQVAKSPALKIGQAKTAVGALLAQKDTQAMPPPFRTYRDMNITSLHRESSILPSRAWLLEDDQSVEAHDVSVEMPYKSLNGSTGAFSPPRSSPSRSYHEELVSDTDSSIHASPSSNRGISRPQLPDTSFTRGFLQTETSYLSGAHPYDFDPIVDNEYILSSSDHPGPSALNMSGISQSTAKDLERLHSLADEDMRDGDKYECHQKGPSEEERFRMQNERHIKEDLLLSTLERLHDDQELVLEVMDSLKEYQGQCVVSMLPEEENLFTGFQSSTRQKLLGQLDNWINDLQTKPLVHSKEGLLNDLLFCRSLVHASTSSSEKLNKIQYSITGIPQHAHRWRRVAGFRASLGFDEAPRSPETVRGGDTSLFSLPSESANDATPYTSNLSMTSTITSAVSPDRHGHLRSRHAFRQVNLQNTIEMVCILFDQLSGVFDKIVAVEGHTDLPNEIQSIYQQLSAVSSDELKALIDSFELNLQPLNISRMVSEDRGDTQINYSDRMELPEHRQSLIHSNGQNISQQLVSQSMGIALEALDVNLIQEGNEERDNYDIFSPNTEDMQSLEPSTVTPTDVMDDLRRTVGSFDLENVEEERDASPPTVEQDENSTRSRRGKGRRGIFQRRHFRKRQSAE